MCEVLLIDVRYSSRRAEAHGERLVMLNEGRVLRIG